MLSTLLLALMLFLFLCHWRFSVILALVLNGVCLSMAFAGEGPSASAVLPGALALISNVVPGGPIWYVIATIIWEAIVAKAPIKPNSTVELGVHLVKGALDTLRTLKKEPPSIEQK